MKLLLLSLLTVVCCCVWVNGTVEEKYKRLDSLLEYVEKVEKKTNGDHLVNTPPRDMQDRCCLKALECFAANLQFLQFNYSKSVQLVRKLTRSLEGNITVETMQFCHSNTSLPSCHDSCHMHPKKSTKEFLEKLKSLIQRAYANLAGI